MILVYGAKEVFSGSPKLKRPHCQWGEQRWDVGDMHVRPMIGNTEGYGHIKPSSNSIRNGFAWTPFDLLLEVLASRFMLATSRPCQIMHRSWQSKARGS